MSQKTCRPVPGFIHDLTHVAANCLDRNAELQNIIQAVIDAGTRNGWLAGHLTVGSGDGVDNGNSSKQSITRTLPVLDLTAWETTPKAPATNNLSSSESQHVIASDLNSTPQSETTLIA